MTRMAGGHKLNGKSEFLSAEYYDAANDIVRTHTPWRRAVAAGVAALFTLTLVLLGLICSTQTTEPANFTSPNSFARP